MNTENATLQEEASDMLVEDKGKLRKKNISKVLFGLALLIFLISLQSMGFYSRYQQRIESANEELFSLITEKTRAEVQLGIQQQFRSLLATLKDTKEISGNVNDLYEVMAEHFREDPLGTVTETHAGLLSLPEALQVLVDEGTIDAIPDGAMEQIAMLAMDLEKLLEIYEVPYEELQSDLESPPFYLWPTAGILARSSGYINSVTFNRAVYLAQIGEMGTARVLLTGLHASATEPEMVSKIYYGLGRLQWELFLSRAEPENYFQAVKYLRQSMQTDPQASLPKRVFDYMLSLTQAESTPGAGKGDPTTLTEGEAGAVSDGTPMF